MTRLKTTKEQRAAHMAFKGRAKAMHLPESEGGLCKVILNLDDLVQDGELAAELEEENESLREENARLRAELDKHVGVSWTEGWINR